MKKSELRKLIKEEIQKLNEAPKMCKCAGPPKFHCAPKALHTGWSCKCCDRLIDFVNQNVNKPNPAYTYIPEAEIQGCEIRRNGSCKGSCPENKPCKMQHWIGVGSSGVSGKVRGDEVKFCSC